MSEDDKPKLNGSGNGHDKKADKIVHFPTLAERDRTRKEKQRQERAQETWRAKNAPFAGQKNATPFFNFSKIPPFTRVMVMLLIAIHIPLHFLVSSGLKLQILYMCGFVPGYFTGAVGEIPWFAPLGLFTHVLIHSDFMHLTFNAIMMLAFGVFFERIFGARRTGLFFMACGVMGALFYFALNPLSTVPVIGASGSISGLFAAVIMLMHERGQMGGFARFGYGPWPMIGFWAVLMIVLGLLSGGAMGASVAWQAHLGGFLGGAALFHAMRKGLIRL